MSVKSNKQLRRTNQSVNFYLEELTSRVVAQTGIPSDRFHLGKIILQSFKDDPDFISQIDGALDAVETNRSVMERSVRCAIAFKNLGLDKGDVMIIMAHNHIDLAIPFYAAMYLGVNIAGVDITLGVRELESTFEVHKPKIIFCQTDKASDIETALNKQKDKTHIVTFDKGNRFCCFTEFLQKHYDGTQIEDFKPNDFDPDDTVAFLPATSGTTGLPKAAMITHKNLRMAIPNYISSFYDFPTPMRLYLLVSPLQWLSAVIPFTSSPIFRYTRLQTSSPATREHIYELINKYKPTGTIMSPTLLMTLTAPEHRGQCDFTHFETFFVGGSHISKTLIAALKIVAPKAFIINMYGSSEASGVIFSWEVGAPTDSLGKPSGHLQHRFVDPTTLEDVDEPNVPAELWIKGPSVFKGYYNNPEITKESFTEDGWFKTGDLVKRDENYNYFFVDRMKMLLKYRNHQVSPIEVEEVIRKHPGVQDVVVVGKPDAECGDLPTACVVIQNGFNVTEQEIKDLVKENLTDSKQLRGGVIFLNELPTLVTTKVDRMKLKKMVSEMK